MYENAKNLITSPQRSGALPQTKKQQAVYNKRENNLYSRNYGASPVFSFSNEDILTGEEYLIDLFEDKPAIRKYGVMTNFVIQNNSSETLTIYLNQNRQRAFVIPAGVIRSFEQQEIQGGVLSLIIHNSGTGTASEGLVTTEFFKTGEEIDSAFQKLHKKIFKLGGY